MSEKNYVTILIESLEKKNRVLNQLLIMNQEQYEAIKDNKMDFEAFDKVVEQKGQLIDKLELLDSGFQKVYDRVKIELDVHKDKHTLEIKKMQELISQLTDKSVSIQTSEERNKAAVEQYFSRERRGLAKKRMSVKVANDYYKSMNKLHGMDSQLLDQTK